jgi:hypothetical protein
MKMERFLQQVDTAYNQIGMFLKLRVILVNYAGRADPVTSLDTDVAADSGKRNVEIPNQVHNRIHLLVHSIARHQNWGYTNAYSPILAH